MSQTNITDELRKAEAEHGAPHHPQPRRGAA